ncbi:MAG: phenylalanine--tRNA ligase subunit alpha [bacterium]
MNYSYPEIQDVAVKLKDPARITQEGKTILRAPEFNALFSKLKNMDSENRAKFGKEINDLKNELESIIEDITNSSSEVQQIDVTAPTDLNISTDHHPKLLSSSHGSKHPLMVELDKVLDIFYRMGFTAVESRQIDDDYHMFESLNFPEGHPARDDFDTFMTTDGLIAPAQTSTMQNRILKAGKDSLIKGNPIATVVPGRVFRNEDVDARHGHTFYQLEGIYVNKGVNTGHLISTFKTFLEEYYGQKMELILQPFYFPFTEPSFEFVLSCPFCQKKGCNICSQTGWIELGGCGMIHPNVLKMAGIDSEEYTGFAWGFGIDRLVMMKYGIEDIRHFMSGKIEFLRQF